MRSKDEYTALGVNTFGLPPSLFVPIAAVAVEAVDQFVGTIVQTIEAKGRVNALLVEAPRPVLDQTVPLWRVPEADGYADLLHPEQQVWVHVDCRMPPSAV